MNNSTVRRKLTVSVLFNSGLQLFVVVALRYRYVVMHHKLYRCFNSAIVDRLPFTHHRNY